MAGTSFDIAVIGGGIAGLTAAHHAALAGVSVAHFIADGMPGGLVMNVGALDGWPAAGAVGGAELAAGLLGRNEELGVSLVPSRIDKIEGAAAKTLSGPDGTWRAKQVIVATGASLRTLDVPGAERLAGRGVSQCAWCDGGLYRDAEVVVAGGGDAALSEAIHLAEFARSVTIVTRGEMFRARRSYVSRVAERRALQAALGERDRRGPGRQGRRRRARARQRGRQRGGRGLQRPVRVRGPGAQCRLAVSRRRARRAWVRDHRCRTSRRPHPACSPSAPCARAMAAG